MHKRDKVLMIIVSILLCLTLISTSMLSWVFAKYASEDGNGYKIKLKKFGADVTVEVMTDNLPEGATYQNTTPTSVANKSISYTISGLKMGPDDTLSEIIHFNFSGTANVYCQLKIDAIIEYKRC